MCSVAKSNVSNIDFAKEFTKYFNSLIHFVKLS